MLLGLKSELSAWWERIVSWMPGTLGFAARRRYLMRHCAKCAGSVRVGHGIEMAGAENIRIGDRVIIGHYGKLFAGRGPDGSSLTLGAGTAMNYNVMLNADCGGVIEIGENVLIGPNVVMRACNHVYASRETPIICQGNAPGRIIVGDDVWFGAGAVVLAGVTIGRGAVIGAGAVVTKDVPPFEIHGGVPARRIGLRGQDQSAACATPGQV